MNDVSRAVIQLCHAINDACGEVRVGYIRRRAERGAVRDGAAHA